jgi:hypothetical protein
VLELSVRPVGRLGLIVYVIAPEPPVTVAGLNGVAALFCVSDIDALDTLAINGETVTAREKLVWALDPFTSVAVT